MEYTIYAFAYYIHKLFMAISEVLSDNCCSSAVDLIAFIFPLKKVAVDLFVFLFLLIKM